MKKLQLRRETVRRLAGPELETVQGGTIIQATTVLARKTVEITISANTMCASSCITDPPTCLCPTFGCPDDGR